MHRQQVAGGSGRNSLVVGAAAVLVMAAVGGYMDGSIHQVAERMGLTNRHPLLDRATVRKCRSTI